MKARKGFTLIEVMVAMSILGVALVAALELFAGSLRLAGNSVSQTQALVLGRSLMDHFLWQSVLPRDGNYADTTRDGYHWSAYIGSVEPELGASAEERAIGASSDEYELKQIVVTVSWSGAAGEKSVVLKTARVMEKF